MSDPVEVRILDREYLVACQPQEREGLVAAATFVDGRMRELRGGNKMAGVDRIAVLTALNLAHELMQLKRGSGDEEREFALSLKDLHRKLDGLIDSVGR